MAYLKTFKIYLDLISSVLRDTLYATKDIKNHSINIHFVGEVTKISISELNKLKTGEDLLRYLDKRLFELMKKKFEGCHNEPTGIIE